ncbi:ubiquitin binding protein [Peniophora sp. CONT]|nr:ubiquitin binding protein [Peniophora sp. CONT]
MASLGTWLWGSSQLDEAVDKATSELLPAGTEDIALNLEICDQIRSKSVPPKDAARALKRRLNHKNPNVQLLTLGLADVCVKNGGDHFLIEVASREFMDNLSSILRSPTVNGQVKTKLLRLIQNWALAFGQKPQLAYAGQVYKELKTSGFDFPPEDPASLSTAMVDTTTAPEWIDSDVCLRCRDAFSFTNRKHHCRNCGRVFDHKCSSRNLPLPHFGVAQEVRVCDGCWKDLTKNKVGESSKHRSSKSVPGSSGRKSGRAYEDAELQRAIALSLQETSARGEHGRPGYVPYQPQYAASEPPLASGDDEDADMKAAIEASLRESSGPRPSAPLETPRAEASSFNYGTSQSYPPYSSSTTPTPYAPYGVAPVPTSPNELSSLEADTIMTFSQTVETLAAQGGRDLGRYPALGELREKATGLRPKMAVGLEDAGRKEELLGEMNDKLAQAVKLYDALLTEQLSRPRYAYAPQQQQYAQPQQQQYGQPPQAYGQQTAYGQPQQQAYGQPAQQAPYAQQQQYAQPAQPQQTGYSPSYAPPQQQQQQAYAPAPPQQGYAPQRQPTQPYTPLQPQLTGIQQQAYPQHVSSPPPIQQQQQQTYAPPPPPTQLPSSPPPAQQSYTQAQSFAPPPPVMSPPPAQSSPVQSYMPSAPPSASYAPSAPPPASYAAPPPVMSPPPVSAMSPPPAQQYPSQPQQQTWQQQQPVQPAHTPFVPPQQASYTPSAPAQPSYAPQQQQPAPQQQSQFPSTPQQMPVFPSAPTSAPVPTYMAPAPEQREVALIEL